MKKIIKTSPKDIKSFSCSRCGCLFQSDEYVVITVGIRDECPNCGEEQCF